MKIIDLLNKIANGELEENTKFYDKDKHKTYIYKPKSYSGIFPEGKAYSDENWYLTLIGSFRLLDEVEIIEDTPKEDKKLPEKLGNTYMKMIDKDSAMFVNFSQAELKIIDVVNALITYLENNGEENE